MPLGKEERSMEGDEVIANNSVGREISIAVWNRAGTFCGCVCALRQQGNENRKESNEMASNLGMRMDHIRIWCWNIRIKIIYILDQKIQSESNLMDCREPPNPIWVELDWSFVLFDQNQFLFPIIILFCIFPSKFIMSTCRYDITRLPIIAAKYLII